MDMGLKQLKVIGRGEDGGRKRVPVSGEHRDKQILFKSLFLPRVAEFIYIEGDNKRVCLLLVLYILSL